MFSLEVEAIEKFELMSKLRHSVIPLIWVEESVNLNKSYTNIFRFGLHM